MPPFCLPLPLPPPSMNCIDFGKRGLLFASSIINIEANGNCKAMLNTFLRKFQFDFPKIDRNVKPSRAKAIPHTENDSFPTKGQRFFFIFVFLNRTRNYCRKCMTAIITCYTITPVDGYRQNFLVRGGSLIVLLVFPCIFEKAKI